MPYIEPCDNFIVICFDSNSFSLKIETSAKIFMSTYYRKQTSEKIFTRWMRKRYVVSMVAVAHQNCAPGTPELSQSN